MRSNKDLVSSNQTIKDTEEIALHRLFFIMFKFYMYVILLYCIVSYQSQVLHLFAASTNHTKRLLKIVLL